MLEKLVINQNYQKSLEVFRDAINREKVKITKNIPATVFLCGANKNKNQVSARREALLDFAKKRLPHTQFFLAESLFKDELILRDRNSNLLDLEESLSKFADRIVIILESSSAFTELGAFCHESLRKKLIVINDSKYRDSESYINLGPIKAIKNELGENYVITYKMNCDGVNNVDSIGDVFDPLYKLLSKPSPIKFEPVTLDQCDPGKHFSKLSVIMMHDIIHMCGPILHRELVPILEIIFGNKDFKITEHTAVLVALKLVSRKEDRLFRSSSDSLIFNYRHFDINKIVSVFRNHIQKHCPSRIYEY